MPEAPMSFVKPPRGTLDDEVTNMRKRDRSSCEKLRRARQNHPISGSLDFQPLTLGNERYILINPFHDVLRSISELVHVDTRHSRDENWYQYCSSISTCDLRSN